MQCDATQQERNEMQQDASKEWKGERERRRREGGRRVKKIGGRREEKRTMSRFVLLQYDQ
eukprot:2500695-Ditylum_brightwellii.AAC.1